MASGKTPLGGPIVRAADGQALAVNNESGPPRYQTSDGQQPAPPSQQPPVQQQIPQGVTQGQYREQYPQRAASNRLSAHLAPSQPSPSFQQQPGPPQPGDDLDPPRGGAYPPQASPAVYAPEPKKQSLRSRIAAGYRGHKEDEAEKKAAKNGIGRSQSVRQSDTKPQEYSSPEAHRLQASQQWHQRQGSSPHLPTSSEHDEDNLDPFLQQDEHDTPQVPPKDAQYQQSHPQFPQNPHQDQYSRPPLGRVSTEGSYQAQGGVDHYSPDQHQGQGLQQPPQQPTQPQQYQTYQPPLQHPQASQEYKAFIPQNTPSPLLQNAQLHGQSSQGQDLAQQQQQGYYKYQQQQQQQQVPQQVPQQVQNSSPLDNPQPNVHYQQQHQFVPQSQPRQGQDPQQLQSQTDLQHSQSTRQPPQLIQQGQQIDAQQPQQLRPPSSQQQFAPPSPLQQPPYQAQDAQQGKQSQLAESRTLNITPPQQSQDNMAPSGQANSRGTVRKVNDGQQPGAPSRETSLLQQPSAQGQTLGQPPVSPGIASFDANVVPTASQGQPYRGDKQGQQTQQGGDLGRATPPPRAPASDMTDDEIEKIIKDHDVLRE